MQERYRRSESTRGHRRTIASGRLVGAALVLGVLSFVETGCEECAIQGRFMEFRVAETVGAVTTEAFLDLNQTRGAEDAAYVIWSVRVSPLADPVTAVRLRAGTPDEPAAVLYDFPLVNAVPAAGVITQVFENTPYEGAVPFDELWELIQGEPVFVEVVFAGAVPPLGIGPLQRANEADWRDILCT